MELSSSCTGFPFPWDTGDTDAYGRWRSQKIRRAEAAVQDSAPVQIANLARPSEAELGELVRRCGQSNASFYASDRNEPDSEKVREQLRSFAEQAGLQIAEKHRSAGASGIVALSVTNAPAQRGYIPYSKRPMNWHTDGYYNAPDQRIRAMVLHCVEPAEDGGVNQFLDPEIAYIRLRDEDPAFIDALMHPEAMTIPENQESDGSLRPASIGPVFSVDPTTQSLEMRYTARTRSISWRDDDVIRSATEFLTKILSDDDPFMQTIKMEAGQGVLCNNSLHNRTGFDPNNSDQSNRMLYRIRFHNRVSGS